MFYVLAAVLTGSALFYLFRMLQNIDSRIDRHQEE